MMPQTMKLLCELKTEVRFPIEAKELEQAYHAVQDLEKLPEIRKDLVPEIKEKVYAKFYLCQEIYDKIAESMLLSEC